MTLGRSNAGAASDGVAFDRWMALAVLLVVGYLVAVSLPAPGPGSAAPGEDEGFRLYVTWRVSLGELPYRDFFDNQFPNLHLVAAPFVDALGRRVNVPRWIVLTFLGTLAAGFLATSRRLERRWSPGAIAILLLLLSPLFHAAAIQFRPDVPAAAVGLVAVLVSFGGRARSGSDAVGPGLVVTSGFLFGLACFIKPTPLYWLPGLLVGGLWVDRTRHGRIGLLRFGAGLLIALLAQAVLWHGLSGGDVWRQVVAANRVPVPGSSVWTVIGDWGRANAWLFPGLLLWAFGEDRGDLPRVLGTAGLFGLAGYLVVHPNTPYPRHLLFVTAVWAYPAGLGYARGWTRAGQARSRLAGWGSHLLAGILIVGAAVGIQPRDPGSTYRIHEADWIRAHTRRGDVVLTDDGGLNYLAGRPRPPALTNVSANLTMGGVITAEDVRRSVANTRPAMIHFHVYPGAWHLANVPGVDTVLADWFADYRYRGLRVVDGKTIMVFTSKDRPITGLKWGPGESVPILEPILIEYGWERTLGVLRERFGR